MFEAAAGAVATNLILGYPWPICFAHGFTLAAVSPAVVVPSMMCLHKEGYGTDKGIPTTTIAASSFDDIIAITAFGIFMTISFNEAPGGVADIADPEKGDSVGFEVLMNLVQLVTGFVVGMGLGFCIGKPIHMIKHEKCRKITKLIFVMVVAILMPFVAEWTTFVESKFVGIIFFGYMCFKLWGEEKPEHALGQIWMFCQPLLFGTVGAAVLFENINPSELGTGIIIIMIGLCFRWIGAYMAFCEKKYTRKEAAFVAFAWIPKATV
jgi:NhaP-type Na+/H+ or K+/H+ antiporter